MTTPIKLSKRQFKTIRTHTYYTHIETLGNARETV